MALSEFEIIQQIFQQQKVDRQDVRIGIGDDAAIVDVPEGYELAVSMDTLIEGVHFPENMKPKDIGYRSLAVNLSDLAAMGAEPAWLTLALTIPESNETWLSAFASGLFGLAEQHNVQLIGGDTTRGQLSITVQVHGLLPKGKGLSRSGAQVGDQIYITGTLGDAAAGLEVWDKTDKSYTWLKQRLARPAPQIEAGITLRQIASSAVDISDGLVSDLGHILTASDVGASINLEALPLSLALCEVVELKNARELALIGGDDYELCFTVPAKKVKKVESLELASQISLIGEIEAEPGLRCLARDGSEFEVKGSTGYQHFP